MRSFFKVNFEQGTAIIENKKLNLQKNYKMHYLR